ncbi:MAG: outer membrane beta-barrel protein [Pseudomonadales bacterium]|nr:outer membrane beta-barrel protein [Pseudomonadales bacterium]
MKNAILFKSAKCLFLFPLLSTALPVQAEDTHFQDNRAEKIARCKYIQDVSLKSDCLTYVTTGSLPPLSDKNFSTQKAPEFSYKGPFVMLTAHKGFFEEEPIEQSFSQGGIQIGIGGFSSRNFGLELRFVKGLQGDTGNIATCKIAPQSPYGCRSQDVEIKIDYTLSAFIRPTLPLSDHFNFYALLGYSRMELVAKMDDFEFSDDESSPSYGLGLSLGQRKGLRINMEYIMYSYGEEFDYSATNVGFQLAY